MSGPSEPSDLAGAAPWVMRPPPGLLPAATPASDATPLQLTEDMEKHTDRQPVDAEAPTEDKRFQAWGAFNHNTFLGFKLLLSERLDIPQDRRRAESDPSSNASSRSNSVDHQRTVQRAQNEVERQHTLAHGTISACAASSSSAAQDVTPNPTACAGKFDDVEGHAEEMQRVLADPDFVHKAVAKGHDPVATLMQIPLDEQTGKLTSLGSAWHQDSSDWSGLCKPCVFAQADQGCKEKLFCRFCHFQHDAVPRIRLRPCKGKRDRYRRLVAKLQSNIEDDPDSFDPDTLTCPPSISSNPMLKARLLARLSGHVEQVRVARTQEDAALAEPEPTSAFEAHSVVETDETLPEDGYVEEHAEVYGSAMDDQGEFPLSLTPFVSSISQKGDYQAVHLRL